MDLHPVLGFEPGSDLAEWHRGPTPTQFQNLLFIGNEARLPGAAMGTGIFHATECFLSFAVSGGK
jgi:hypothetical protein